MSPIEWIGSISAAAIIGLIGKVIWDSKERDKRVDDHDTALYGQKGQGGLIRDVEEIKESQRQQLDLQTEIKVQLLGMEGTGGMIQKLHDIGRGQYRHQEAIQAHEGRLSLLEATIRTRTAERHD